MKQEGWSQRERVEDATLLTSEGWQGQGIRWPSSSGRVKEPNSPVEPSEGTQTC